MSVMTVSASLSDRARQSTESRIGRAVPTPVRPRPRHRPGRGSGRAGGPVARPAAGVAPPRVRPAGAVGSRACVAEPAPLRLTDRGIAVIIVAGLMLVVAALVVVGATALRVTSENYRPTVHQQAQDHAVQGDAAMSARN